MLNSRIAKAGLVAILAGALLAGCNEEESPHAVSYPLSIGASNGEVTLSSAPQRIVSLSESATDTLVALGASEWIVGSVEAEGVDEAATEDLDADATADDVADLDAELVIAAEEDATLAEDLEDAGIAYMVQPQASSLDDVYRQILDIGTAIDRRAEAVALSDEMRNDIRLATTHAIHLEEHPTVFHETAPDYSSVRSNTFVGNLYELFDFHNIADDTDGLDSTPQLSRAEVVEADPDMIFLTYLQSQGQNPESAAARRNGWAELTAVEQGSVYAIEDSLTTKWGPSVVELVESIAQGFERYRTVADVA